MGRGVGWRERGLEGVGGEKEGGRGGGLWEGKISSLHLKTLTSSLQGARER